MSRGCSIVSQMVLMESQGRELITRAEQAVLDVHDDLMETQMVMECNQLALLLRGVRACREIMEILIANSDAIIIKIDKRIEREKAKTTCG